MTGRFPEKGHTPRKISMRQGGSPNKHRPTRTRLCGFYFVSEPVYRTLDSHGFSKRRQCLPMSRIELPSLKRLASKGCGGNALHLQSIWRLILAFIFFICVND